MTGFMVVVLELVNMKHYTLVLTSAHASRLLYRAEQFSYLCLLRCIVNDVTKTGD